jgi:hypothetical protein
MVWLPDHLWAQQKGKGGGKEKLLTQLLASLSEQEGGYGGKGKGKKGAKSSGKGKGRFAQKLGQKQKATAVDPISTLAGCIGKKLKRPVAKDEISYDFFEGEEGGTKMYQATVTSGEFAVEPTYTGNACESKGDAKKDAAKIALESEFPDVFAKISKTSVKVKQENPTKKASPKAKAAAQSKKATSTDAISLLQGIIGKKLKRPLAKDEISYVLFEMGEGPKTYQATVTSSEFAKEPSYTGGEAASKADAKREAAKAAIVAEFPEMRMGIAPTPKAQAKASNADPKSKLCSAVSLILGRPLTKTDLVWESTPTGTSSSCSVTLQIPELASDIFQGNADTKKAAEGYAAQKALKKLGPIAAGKRAENVASGKTKRKLTEEEKEKAKALMAKLQTIDGSQKLWVGGLGEEVTSAQLKACFAKAGKVQMAEKTSRLSAVVVYSSKVEVDKAIRTLQSAVVGGSTISLDYWKNPEKKAKK